MPKFSPESAILSLKSAILALKRGISHTTQGILSPVFHTKAATAVAVRMHRSQQCAAPLAAKTQGFASPQCPNPAFVPSLQELCTAFAAVAAYLCWTSVLCSAKQVVYQAPGADVGHWKIQGRCMVLMVNVPRRRGTRSATSKILPLYATPWSCGLEHLVE